MPERMREDDLPPALRLPEAGNMLAALLDLHTARFRLVEKYHRKTVPTATYLDATVTLHIFVMRRHGTRQQKLIDSLDAPRRTIRNVLARLEAGGLICRDNRGLYHPTRLAGTFASSGFPTTLREVGRLSEAYQGFKDAERRSRTQRP